MRPLPVHMPGLAILPAPHFPLPLTAMHQIELTSHCNLRCGYCPSPEIVRGGGGKYPGRGGAQHMTEATFLRALAHAAYHVQLGTQSELNLAGIGESTLHPRFVEFVRLARAAVGPAVKLIWATNGVAVDEAMVAELAAIKPPPRVWVSLHRPERAGPAVQLYKRYGLLGGVSADPSINANDWAGQVSYAGAENSPMACSWLRAGRGFVMADGRVTACCLDASGGGVIGHVDQEPGTITTKPWEACPDCHHVIAVDGHDQRS